MGGKTKTVFGDVAKSKAGWILLLWIVVAVLAQGLMLESVLELIKALFTARPALFFPGWLALFALGAFGFFAAFRANWERFEPQSDGQTERMSVLRAAASFIVVLMAIGIGLEAIFELVKAFFDPSPASQIAWLILALILSLLIAVIAIARVLAPAVDALVADSRSERSEIEAEEDAPDERRVLNVVGDLIFNKADEHHLKKNPYDVLIVPLSALDRSSRLGCRTLRSMAGARERLDWLCRDEATDDLERFNWRQVFRMLRPHVRFFDNETRVILPEVHLLTSPESDREAGRWEEINHIRDSFTDWVKAVFGNVTIDLRNGGKGPLAAPDGLQDAFRFFDAPVDFEDYDQVYQAIRERREAIEKRRRNARVLIDLTGGPKPVAAAVTVLSLRQPEDRIGYVRSHENSPKGEVFAYRIEATAPRLPDAGIVDPARYG